MPLTIPILFNNLGENLIQCYFYEVLGFVLALVNTAQLTEQSVALWGLDHVVRIQL